MIEHDDGDEFLYDIVQEICSSALNTIHQNYLQKQLIPYTVLQAKDAMLQIIEVDNAPCAYTQRKSSKETVASVQNHDTG